MSRSITVTSLALFLAACSSTPERNAVPEALHEQAEIPGIPEVTFTL